MQSCFCWISTQRHLGRKIVDGEEKIHLFGEEIPVRSKVYTINGFSSHAGQKELLEWISPSKIPKNIFNSW